MSKRSRKHLQVSRHPSADAVLLGDEKLKGRVFYRDTRAAKSVWHDIDDPDARGELVILPE